MVTFAIFSAISYSHHQRTCNSEIQSAVSGNMNCAAASLAALNGTHYLPNDTIVAFRFLPIGIGLQPVPLSIHCNRVKVEDQIVIASDSNDQFDLRASGDG
jgi:hypothetical protein